MIRIQQFKKSLNYAVRGLSFALRHEQNFRIQLVAAIVVLFLALVVHLSNVRLIVLIMLITLVLVLELLNTFFEKLVDLLSPRVHHYVGMLKDILAATVLVASIGAVVVGILIFWPYLVG